MCLTSIPFGKQKDLCISLNNKPTFSVFYNSTYSENNCSTSSKTSESYNLPEMDANNNIHTVPYNSTTNLRIDVSIYNFPKPIWEILPSWEVALKVGTFLPVILLGVFGNMLLIYIILKNRSLKTPTNIIIANMAIADLLTISVCPALFMIHDFYQNYQLGEVGCKLEGFLECVFLITAVLNLAVVSYDRLTAIVLPQETRLTKRGAKMCVLVTWIIGCLFSLPLIIFRHYRERIWKNYIEIYCTENTTVLPMYWHVIISVIVWFPLAVMLICYSAIFWKLDRYEAQVLKRENPISVSYKTRVAKMLFIVVLTFITLRLPFTSLIFVRNQILKTSIMNSVDDSFRNLWYSSHYLIFLNSAVNPIIYGLTNENFRKAYKHTSILRCFTLKLCKNEKSKINGKTRILNGLLHFGQDENDEKNLKINKNGHKWFIFNNRLRSSSGNSSSSSSSTTTSTPIQSLKYQKSTKFDEIPKISHQNFDVTNDCFLMNDEKILIKDKHKLDYSEFI